MPVCEKCGDTGKIPIDDMNVKQCVCAYARALKAHLGPEIAGATLLDRSPFFDPDGEDYTTKNLFIKAYWTDLLPHLKWALGCKGPMFRFRVLTDERLKTIYVGAESYLSRARSKRDDLVTYNSLNDLVGEDLELIIIRLGHLGHKNIAMPGVLKESLMLREVALKPTWLIESPQAPYVPGHFAYSEDTYDYILGSGRFEVVKLSNLDESRLEAVGPQAYGRPTPVASMEVDDSAAPEVVEPEVEMPGQKKGPAVPPSKARETLDFSGSSLDLGSLGSDRKKPFKKGRPGRGG